MRAKKSLGQHFLKSPRIIEKIVESANLIPEDVVVEVGPGKGILTKALLQKVRRVIAIEKDDALIPYLQEVFKKEMASKKLILLHEDILEWTPKKEGLERGSYKIVANIPYYITGVFLRRFLSGNEYPESMTLLVQKEVAERIVASDHKESLFSVGVKAYGIPRYIGTVRAGNFTPPPKVDSAILSITDISKSQLGGIDEEAFFTLVRAGFAHKRKQLVVNFRSAFGSSFPGEEVLHTCNIPPKTRAEDITLTDWKCLARQARFTCYDENMSNRFFYYGTSLLVGYVILSLELLGFRLLAPYFGYSLYVFGSLIGLILFSLSIGYWLGGYCADKNISEQKFFKIVFLGGIYLVFVATFSHFFLSSLAKLHIITGTLLATALFFAAPMVVLAALSPYFIKILSARDNQAVGVSAGSVYAIGTIGSLFGTFLTSFFLIPTFGAIATLFSNGVLMLLLSIPWIIRRKNIRILMILFACIVPSSLYVLSTPQNDTTNIVAKADSAYNHLEIVDYGRFWGLRTDQRNNIVYSTYPKDGVWDYERLLYTLFALPPLINNAKTSLLLGLGAGTLPLLHRTINPDLEITGLEIDPEIVRLGREYFGLSTTPNLTTIIEDARPFLAHTRNLYDFIEIDLFWGGGEIPFYLASQEFFKLTAKHLTPQGLVAMNIYDPSPKELIAAPLINTIRSVYPYVYRTRAPNGSHFVFASKNPVDYRALDKKIDATRYDPKFLVTVSYFEENTKPVEFKQNLAVFTDDWTPIEKLSYRAIFSNN